MKIKLKYSFVFAIILFSFFALAQIKPEANLEQKMVKDTLKKEKLIQLIQMGDSLVEIRGNFISYKKKAHASYYADKFHGRKTASGAKFNMNALTAAHKKLPFGTKLKVTNEANGKFVLVTVNDRGPYVKGRELDLSKKAFMQIANNKGSGSMNVTIEILQK
jgi:rare lipoprotein A